MSKVYVSSTFRDLRTCRQHVTEAVRLLRNQDVAMENYGAEPQPPLDKCLKDVAACDVYIGIFGRRLGWMPPGSAVSITEREYRQTPRFDQDMRRCYASAPLNSSRLNRTGFVGRPIAREDGAHGTTKQVFTRVT
jgi:hypothetical protein